jgi:hypothetical protein
MNFVHVEKKRQHDRPRGYELAELLTNSFGLVSFVLNNVDGKDAKRSFNFYLRCRIFLPCSMNY